MTTARLTTALLLMLLLFASSVSAGDSLSYSAKAQEFMKAGEYEKALDELKAGAALYPYDPQLRRDLALTYANVAEHDLKISHYSEAADYFRQARELFPNAKELGFMRGVALYLDKKYDAARVEFEDAGDATEPLIFLGKISYDTGDVSGALALWRRAQEKDPQNKVLKSLIDKAARELPVESKMDKGYSSMFDLSFDDQLPQGLAAEVLDALEAAYNSVGADLGVFPTARIPVLLYTKSDYRSVTAGPDWSGGLYDGKIRLPVGGISKVTAQMRGIIFHEFTHVVIAELTRGNIPTWLNEGLAEVEGRKAFSHQTVALSQAAKGGKLIPLATLSGSFTSMANAEAGLAYQQSYSMANYIVSRYGWYSIQQILKSLDERETIETAVSKALADYSLDMPALYKEWREGLKE
jgi:tetratricopeptide (TPR) repeat protein